MTNRPAIDLNCDLGEAAGHDAALMPLISSANVASGGHAGDRRSIAVTVARARDHGVAIGCHPGHADPAGFGRRPLPISPTVAADLVATQLAEFAAVAGDSLRHLKLHGALYHQVGGDEPLATAVSRRLAADWPQLMLFAPAGSRLATIAAAEGLRVVAEGFADRRYAATVSLLPRSDPAALITDPAAAAAQAVAIATAGRVHDATGQPLSLFAETLCIHGDGPAPVRLLKAVRQRLVAANFAIEPPRAETRG